LILVCVLLAVATSVAVAQRPPSDPGCCTPWQWIGSISITNRALHNQQNQKIFYDYKNNRLRVDDIATDGSNFQLFSIIERFDLGLIYNVNYTSGTCTFLNVTGGMPPACVPKGATATYNVTLGSSLRAKVYNFRIPPIVSTITSTVDSCLPISGVVLGRLHGHMREADIFYYNIAVQTPNPGLFTPPNGCKQM